MEFTVYCPTKIHFGENSLAQLLELVRARQLKRLALVYDHNLADHPLLCALRADLELKSDVLAQAVQVAEPTYRFLDSYRTAFMDAALEAVVGVGGGSTLDTAKAIAVLVHNRGPAVSYRGFNKMTEPVLPVYAVPTTAGTGSEITPNASFVDDEVGKKLGINGEAIRPQAAFLHPGFIMTCPKKPATYSAIDALVHSIEAFAAKKATLPAKMFASHAVLLLTGNIVRAVRDKDQSAVEHVFWGSLLAALAMMHSGTGPTAALSYPLGVHCKIPHGLAGAVFLRQVMQWNISKGYTGYAALHPEQSPTALLESLSAIWNALDVPVKAGEVGFKKEYADLFLSDLRDLWGAIEQNPIAMQESDLKELLLMSA